ncbi:MAG TPA: hypothetical protein VGP16_07385 [Asanoa sp.]|jgi:hypothetical protein|nr:hypothetical protein [Asanoa sp.]
MTRAAEKSLGHRDGTSGTTHYLLALLDAPIASPLLDVDAGELCAQVIGPLSEIPSAWS